MKLVFFGTPKFAVPTLISLNSSKYDLIKVVTAADKRSGRGLKVNPSPIKKKAIELNLPVIEVDNLNDQNFINSINNLKPDIFIIVAFKILPEKLFKIPSKGAINLHASLLPKYRGASPINYSLLNGDSYTGLTTFMIEKRVDQGLILLQEKININAEISYGELYDSLSKIGSKLVINTLDGISKGNIIPKLQDNNNSSRAPKINTSRDCKINWQSNSLNIHNLIRAFSPNPGAYTLLNNKRIKILKSKLINLDYINNILPGQINYIDPYLIVGTKNGYLSILELQLEGKKRISATTFYNGYSNYIGKSFD